METRLIAAATQNTPNVHKKCCHCAQRWRGRSPGGIKPVSQVQKICVKRGSAARVLRMVSGCMAFSFTVESIESAGCFCVLRFSFASAREKFA